MNKITFDMAKTALVAVDLHEGMPFDYKPYPYSAVVDNTVKLARAFSRDGAFIVLLRVPTAMGKDKLNPVTDLSMTPGQLADAAKKRALLRDNLVPELSEIEDAHVITKLQWGSFYGTDLDLQLRRRGIDTIVLCGIATGFGVDTTAREAYQHGYQQVFAEDAMTALSEQEQNYVCKYIFPMMGRVRSTSEILSYLSNL